MKKKYFTREEKMRAHNISCKNWYDTIKEDKKQKRLIYKLENQEELAKQKEEKIIKSKELRKLYKKEYLEKNKDKIKLQRRERYLKNKDHYIENNNKRKKEREGTEPLYKFYNNVRRNIKRSFFRNNTLKFKKTLKSEIIIGCSLPEFAKYILLQCPEGTTFENFGQFGYHLDHIIPISLAKTQEEVEKLCHYTNYQPLWCTDNIIKSNKIIEYV